MANPCNICFSQFVGVKLSGCLLDLKFVNIVFRSIYIYISIILLGLLKTTIQSLRLDIVFVGTFLQILRTIIATAIGTSTKSRRKV